jgi:hypothetical protein
LVSGIAEAQLGVDGSVPVFEMQHSDARITPLRRASGVFLTIVATTTVERSPMIDARYFFHCNRSSLAPSTLIKDRHGICHQLNEIYDGVIDTRDCDHPDGYQRVVAVTTAAVLLDDPAKRSTFWYFDFRQ